MRLFISSFLLAALASFTSAHAATVAPPSIAEIQTSVGTVTIQLNWEKAPISSRNFLDYIQKGFYKNTIFHRVIKNFMIQGGGVDAATGKFKTIDTPTIKNEADNGLSNTFGTIAMARTSAPDSASSQFFINTVDNKFLDKTETSAGYAVFGEVVAGMDVASKIGNFATYSELPFSDTNSLVVVDAVYTSNALDKINSRTRITVNGSGVVTSTPSTLNCDGVNNKKCVAATKIGGQFSVIAKAATGFEFAGWRGDCQGVKTTLPINTKTGNHNCTATFVKTNA